MQHIDLGQRKLWREHVLWVGWNACWTYRLAYWCLRCDLCLKHLENCHKCRAHVPSCGCIGFHPPAQALLEIWPTRGPDQQPEVCLGWRWSIASIESSLCIDIYHTLGGSDSYCDAARLELDLERIILQTAFISASRCCWTRPLACLKEEQLLFCSDCWACCTHVDGLTYEQYGRFGAVLSSI